MTSELISRYQKLYSSLVSDCVEEAGYAPQAAEPGLQPFHTDQLRVVVGRAHPLDVRATSEHVEIDMLLAAVEATPPDSLVVVAADRDPDVALWGGLMSAGVLHRGGVGAVVDGGVRDLHQIAAMDFPVFAAYRSPLDIRGRAEVVDFGTPVTFRGLDIVPGQLVFADANGIVAVPPDAEEQVLEQCEDLIEREQTTQQELEAGGDPAEVYEQYGAF